MPPPQNLTISRDFLSALVRWTKPNGLDDPQFRISLYAGDNCLKTIIKCSQECSFELEPDTAYTIAISTVLKNGKRSRGTTKSISTSRNCFLILHLQQKYISHLGKMYSDPQTCHKPGVYVCRSVRVCVLSGIPVPDNLKSSSVTSTSVALAWSLTLGEVTEPHSFLISYQSDGNERHSVSSDSCSTVITGLKPHTQYFIRVTTKIQNWGESQPATLTVTTGEIVTRKNCMGIYQACVKS